MPNSSNFNNSLDHSLTDNPLASGIPEGGIQELDDRLPEIVSEEIAPLEDIPILDETDRLLSGNAISQAGDETTQTGDADPLIGETSKDSPAENVSESDPLTNPIESSDTSDEVDGDTETVQKAIEPADTSDETETSPTQADDIQQPLEVSENSESEDSQDESPDAIDSADADNTELPPVELPQFDSGIFTVNGNGEVGVDFLHDGGKFKFELAIFSLEGMEEFWSDDDSTAFIAEAARRAASGSELGYIVISDAAEGAKFSGSLEGGQDWNAGNYEGVKTFQMRPGDKFAVMLVPNGKVSQVLANPEVGGTKRPLFSLATANPDDGLHFGQIADVTGDGNTFVMEDMRVDGNSDFDYNDIIFQVRGATGTAGLLDEAIDPAKDWRETDLGQALIEYAKPYITPDTPDDGESVDDGDSDNPDDGTDGAIDPPVDEGETPSEEVTDDEEEDTDDNSEDVVTDEVTGDGGESPIEDTQNTDDNSEDVVTDEVTGDSGESPTEDTQNTEDNPSPPIEVPDTVPPERIEFPRENQPLIGIIDTGFAANNPDIDYSNITLGSDRVNGDDNPLQAPGEGSEHGTHILGIIAAEQDNGVGIDGINDDAPIWVGQAIGSGDWAESLVEFVDAAKESEQPNAVVNLSLDLTQVNPDGSVTTRYELTPKERAAIEYARQNNVLLVVAAGNDGGVMSALGQASQEFDNIITVGSAERVNDELSDAKAHDRASYSSYGQGLDILARGGTDDNPELSLSGESLGTMSGTSVATAKVTGAISQVWAANPELSYRQAIEIVKDTATDLGTPNWDTSTGAGLVNTSAAVLLAKATQPEEHIAPSSWIPDTWSGADKVTPSERAVATQFKGKYYDWKPYTIQWGDTLSAIAQRTMGNGTAPYYNFIAQRNGIANPNLIYTGNTILIPDQVAAPAPPPPPTPAPTPAPVAPPPPIPAPTPAPAPPPPPSGYYPDLASLTNTQWNEYTKDNTRFDVGWPDYRDERHLTPKSIRDAYTDLSKALFGKRYPVTAGYLLDPGYRQGIGKWHSGLDIDTPNWEPVKALVGGTTTMIQNKAGDYFVGVRGDDGKLWIYGHLGSFDRPIGSRIEAGQTIGKVGSVGSHLHLEVQAGPHYRSSQSANLATVRNATLNPIQSFWELKNGNQSSQPGNPGNSSPSAPPAIPGQQMQYIVKPGDTLWAIARQFLGNGNRWRELQKNNGSRFTDADASSLQVGQSVYIPVSYEQGTGKPVTNPPSSTPSPNSGINWVNFSGTVGPSIGVNLRNSTRNSDRSSRNEPHGKKLEFDGWKYGETLTDIWLGKPDSRWFKVKGTNLWVPSAYIFGNPPSSGSHSGGGAVGNVTIDAELIIPSPTISISNVGNAENGSHLVFRNQQIEVSGTSTTPELEFYVGNRKVGGTLTYLADGSFNAQLNIPDDTQLGYYPVSFSAKQSSGLTAKVDSGFSINVVEYDWNKHNIGNAGIYGIGGDRNIIFERINSPGYIENKPTWVLIHGWDGKAGGFKDLGKAIEEYDGIWGDDQVLTLDWDAARTGKLGTVAAIAAASDWIEPVAQNAANILSQSWGIDPLNINLVGHSLGSYVSYEISEELNGINKLIALAPASTTFGGYTNRPNVDFSKHSKWSWGFYHNSTTDSKAQAKTADESFQVDFQKASDFEGHSAIKNLWENMLKNKNGSVSQYFGLEDIGSSGKPWHIDKPGLGSGWEAEITAKDTEGLFSSNWVPDKFKAI